MLSETIVDLATALGLGLLVGLQKERAQSPLAGVRTFTLVSLAGASAALLGSLTTPWMVVGALLAITALMVIGNVVLMSAGEHDPGQTTEVAVVATYLIGAMTVVGSREVAIVLGATIAMLLHLKEELKSWVGRMSDRDVRAMMQFIVIWLVIFPILPDRTFGPYDVLNPREIWLMVVLIVGINLAGYGAFRVMGARAGTALAGILGGVVSSTATTISYARTTKDDEDLARTAVAVVWIASGVVYVRLMLEVGAVAPAFLPVAVGPLGVMLATFLVLGGVVWRTATAPGESPLDPGNPSELRPAILFGVLYAAVLLVVAAAEALLGDVGLYAAALVSGLTDVDAITLSTSNLVRDGRLDPGTGWRLIVLASLSNLVFKLSIAASLGSRAFATRLWTLGAVALAIGGGILFLWP